MGSIRHIAAVINVYGKEQTAARRAADLAAKLDAKLSLFAVVYQPEAAFDLFHIIDGDRVRDQFVSGAQERLDQLVKQLGLEPERVRTEVYWKQPFDAGAIRAIRQLDADLLVVAARDETCRRFSNSEWRLLHASPVPVIVARPRPWNDPAVIMACVDPGHNGDEDASVDQRILNFAGSLHPQAGHLEVFHALGEIPDAIAVAQSPEEYRRELRASREKKIRRLLPDRLRDELQLHMVEAEPEHAMIRLIESRPVSLVVMGVYSRSNLLDFLIGSTARRILPSLPCDFMAVPAYVAKNKKGQHHDSNF